MIKRIIKKVLDHFNLELKTKHNLNVLTFDNSNLVKFENLYRICKKESLNISKERFLTLYQSINYVFNNDIQGDFVECGIFKGGSAMMMAFMLTEQLQSQKNQKIWMYDTFEGMANVSKFDENIDNQKAFIELDKIKKKENSNDIWAYSSLNYVKNNLKKTNINENKLIYIKGLVEETLHKTKPERIALLRLDTDFYESTKIELELLYPLLQKGGILIVDDYGHWKGCKKAVDEYFLNKKDIFFQQIDYSGIVGVKTK
jgi:O-methyltransferase